MQLLLNLATRAANTAGRAAPAQLNPDAEAAWDHVIHYVGGNPRLLTYFLHVLIQDAPSAEGLKGTKRGPCCRSPCLHLFMCLRLGMLHTLSNWLEIKWPTEPLSCLLYNLCDANVNLEATTTRRRLKSRGTVSASFEWMSFAPCTFQILLADHEHEFNKSCIALENMKCRL